MKQTTERRGETRKPAAFTLWYQRPGRHEWRGGWAMNISSGGLAAIVPPDDPPHVGEVVRLVPLAPPSAVIADAIPVGLPPAGRVVRLDPHGGMTRQIAIAFDAHSPAELNDDRERTLATGLRPEAASKSASGLVFGARDGAAKPKSQVS